MRKILVTVAVVMVFGGATAGWLILQNKPASAPKNKTPLASKNEKAVNPKEHSYTDVDFAKKMIVHNQQGIQMADVAKKNTTNEEVRQIATRISEELSNDTGQYIEWLTEWKETYSNLSDFPEMDGHDMYPTFPGMATVAEVWVLESTIGGAFDKQFLQLMIKHHEGAKEFANGIEFRQLQFGQMIDLNSKRLIQVAEEVQTMKRLQANG